MGDFMVLSRSNWNKFICSYSRTQKLQNGFL